MMKYVSQIIAQQESDVQHFQLPSEQLTQYQHELEEEIALVVSALRGQKQVLPSTWRTLQNTE
ncbi:MAG: hypothetical protein ACR5LD_03470 [Symbiopectobacterium sp.]